MRGSSVICSVLLMCYVSHIPAAAIDLPVNICYNFITVVPGSMEQNAMQK